MMTDSRRQGQVTAFIILGFILLILIGFLLYISIQSSDTPNETGTDQEIDSQISLFESCVDSAKDSSKEVLATDFILSTTNKIQNEPVLYDESATLLEKEQIENKLTDRMETEIENCVDSLDYVDTFDFSTDASIIERKIILDNQGSITFSIDDQTRTYEIEDDSIEHNFYTVYEFLSLYGDLQEREADGYFPALLYRVLADEIGMRYEINVLDDETMILTMDFENINNIDEYGNYTYAVRV